MENTGLCVIFVTSNKIKFRIDSHVGCGNRNILIIRDINTCRIIDFIISACSNREARNISFTMIEHSMYIRWKYRLIKIIHRYSRIGPPQKCLRNRCRIIQPDFNFEICFARVERESRHALLMEHYFIFIHPNGYTAICIIFNGMFHRKERTWPVMLRPVKFNTS